MVWREGYAVGVEKMTAVEVGVEKSAVGEVEVPPMAVGRVVAGGGVAA